MTTKVEQKPTPPDIDAAVEPAGEIKAEQTGQAEPGAAPRLTLEGLLYGLILLLAVALRLWSLNIYPLSEIEAQQSLVALRLYEGQELTSAPLYSPLLASLNTLSFFLFDAGDIAARLAPVLLGVALVLLPLAFRRQLGPAVCLLASVLLAISPTALFLSRTLNGEVGVAAGALMIVAGFFNWAREGNNRWLYLLALGLAVLLTAGPMAYSIIIIFAILIWLKFKSFKTLWQQGLARSTPSAAGPPQPAAGDNQPKRRASAEEDTASSLPPQLRQAAVLFLVVLFLLSTTFTLNFSGFSVTTGLFTDWLSRFTFEPRLDSGFNAVFLLTIYEILLVIVGLVGLTYALLSDRLPYFVFAGWFVGILILDLVMVGRPAGNVILALTPLAFLAALALAELWDALQSQAAWGNEGIIAGSGLVIAAFAYIGLTGWLSRTCSPDDLYCNYAWLQAVAALALFVVIVSFFWLTHGPGIALRGIAAAAVLLGLLAAVNIGWRLNFGPLRNLAYQPLAGVPASPQLVALTETLAGESAVRVGDQTLLDVTVVEPTPTLQWSLRDYDNLNQTDSLSGIAPTSAIITPVPANGDEAPNLGAAYIGQDFAVNAVWSPVGLPPKELIRWLIYREVQQQPPGNRVVLWLRVNQS